MEPLGQTGATGESILIKEEAVVTSIRSAMKELQESIQNLCKVTLAKIITLGQYFSHFFIFSCLQRVQKVKTIPFHFSE